MLNPYEMGLLAGKDDGSLAQLISENSNNFFPSGFCTRGKFGVLRPPES